MNEVMVEALRKARVISDEKAQWGVRLHARELKQVVVENRNQFKRKGVKVDEKV